VRVEKIGEPYTIRLGGKPKQLAVGVESIGAAGLDKLEPGLLATHDEPFDYAAIDAENDVQASGPNLLTWTISARPADARPRMREPGFMSSNATTLGSQFNEWRRKIRDMLP